MNMLDTQENRARLQQALRQAEPLIVEDVHPDPESFAFDAEAGAEVCFVTSRSEAVGVLVSADLTYHGDNSSTARLFEESDVAKGWRALARIRTQDPAVVLRETEDLFEIGSEDDSPGPPAEEEVIVPAGEIEDDAGGQGDEFGTDLVRLARDGGLREIVGRAGETQALVRVASKLDKNAACLVGEAGVGKTAIVEKLATSIAAGQVPDSLANSRILSVNLGFMAAGATVKNQFEGRFKKLLDHARENPTVILFLDEVHMLCGKNDVSQMVKEDLGRGKIRLIGATTPKEYRAIEEDPALARRFQKIPVAEPTQEETVKILRGIRGRVEDHHQIRIPDELLEEVVALSARYVTDRHLPDKAIDLLDEAAAFEALGAERRSSPNHRGEGSFSEHGGGRSERFAEKSEEGSAEHPSELATRNENTERP